MIPYKRRISFITPGNQLIRQWENAWEWQLLKTPPAPLLIKAVHCFAEMLLSKLIPWPLMTPYLERNTCIGDRDINRSKYRNLRTIALTSGKGRNPFPCWISYKEGGRTITRSWWKEHG